MPHIKTKFFDTVNRDMPLNEYPRPQLKRDVWTNLNGSFDFAVTDDTAGIPSRFPGKIIVPFSIETALSGVEKKFKPDEILWYRKVFSLSDEYSGKRVILNFGAVDWKCKVYINGAIVGSHTGGYVAFSFDITCFVHDGENELVVRVYDPSDKGWQQRGKQVLDSKGFWYTATSGIWQTVWLEAVENNYIRSVKLLPDIDKGSIGINIRIRGEGELKAAVYDNGKLIASKIIGTEDSIPLESFECWSPENPKLYNIIFELSANGVLCDRVSSYFGMRKFSIAKDEKGYPRLCLNNKPYYQHGLLDQGYWSDGGLTPPSDEAMIYDIQKMKDLGFNMLRKHIKTEPARWYYHCDRLGMLVWQDMMSGGEYIGTLLAGALPLFHVPVKDDNYKLFSRENKEWRDDYKRELFEMIDMLYNCVSICCWVPFNEGWGQFDAKQIGDEVKKTDPSRFVDHASGWYDRGGGDFKSVHKYILPVRRPRPEARPFVLSEFGGYSMICEGHVWNKNKSFGYVMFKSKEALTQNIVSLYEKQIIPLIPKGLSASVYTQVSDVEFEVNGLLTYDRKEVKADENALREIGKKMKF